MLTNPKLMLALPVRLAEKRSSPSPSSRDQPAERLPLLRESPRSLRISTSVRPNCKSLARCMLRLVPDSPPDSHVAPETGRVFLLSPASCTGRRARMLLRPEAEFDLAV